MNNLSNLHKAMIKAILLLGFLFVTSLTTGQNTVVETKTSITIDGIEVLKGSDSFNNLFEAKYKSNKKEVNLSYLDHAFKVVHIYKNVTVIKIVNNSYYNAKNTQSYIQDLNKTHLIKFIR